MSGCASGLLAVLDSITENENPYGEARAVVNLMLSILTEPDGAKLDLALLSDAFQAGFHDFEAYYAKRIGMH